MLLIVLHGYLVYLILTNVDALDKSLPLLLFAETTLSGDINGLICYYNKRYVDYLVLLMIFGRGIATYAVFHLMEQGNPFFGDIDTKMLFDAAFIRIVPCILFFSQNWRHTLYITVPLIFALNAFTIRASLSPENDNLACYKDPEKFARGMVTRYSGFLFAITLAIYAKARSDVSLFIEKQKV